MEETHHHEHCGQDNVGVGTRGTDVVHHMSRGLRLMANHHDILQGESNFKQLLRASF